MGSWTSRRDTRQRFGGISRRQRIINLLVRRRFVHHARGIGRNRVTGVDHQQQRATMQREGRAHRLSRYSRTPYVAVPEKVNRSARRRSVLARKHQQKRFPHTRKRARRGYEQSKGFFET